MPELPLVPGITETMNDEPAGMRLSDMMSGMMPQPTRVRLANAMSELETVFAEEEDEPTRERIGAALTMLRGTASPDDEPDEPTPSRMNSATRSRD